MRLILIILAMAIAHGVSAQAATEAPAQAVTSESGEISRCDKAVANGRYSVDSLLEVSERNYKNGYLPKADYDNAVSALETAKHRMSVAECLAARGRVKDFYRCLADPANPLVACEEIHGYPS